MSRQERSRTAKKRARQQARDEGIEASVEAMYERAKRMSVLKADEGKKSKEVPEWQRKVGFATNAAGAIAGPAAITMAVQQARRKEGGMPRAAAESAGKKAPKNKAVRGTLKAMRNPKVVAAGGVTAVGLQSANWAGDAIAARALTKKKESGVEKSNNAARDAAIGGTAAGIAGGVAGGMIDRLGKRPPAKFRGEQFRGKEKMPPVGSRLDRASMKVKGKALAGNARLRRIATRNKFAIGGAAMLGGLGAASALEKSDKSIEQSFVSKSDEVVVNGHGQSLVEKRNFDAEADRQRRLGLYAGAGLLGAGAAGAAAAKDIEIKGKDAKNPRQVLRVSRKAGAKTKYFKTRTGALAGLAALSGAGGVAAYRRGISERNYPYV